MKNAIVRKGVLVAVMVTFEVMGVNAQEKPKQRPTIDELFKQMDTNEDGKLSKKEIKGPIKDDFSKIDTDKDGFITKKEMEKAPKPDGKRPPKK
ncbi:EF-hand domain-containing protein [Cellulophaga sp. F20128]|uniref:EF-hand domain-containing protein n=1 Tax=Cellulophaga sp. F20128 TaxID=2926413 RepID=UPI001FF5CFB0|nr:EF-hand domain-containing protein [Cellulophaga sp. F20128]MCK0156777.1 EF-hand domain-containing protein [Cellulophaga sp. F20128]